MSRGSVCVCVWMVSSSPSRPCPPARPANASRRRELCFCISSADNNVRLYIYLYTSTHTDVGGYKRGWWWGEATFYTVTTVEFFKTGGGGNFSLPHGFLMTGQIQKPRRSLATTTTTRSVLFRQKFPWVRGLQLGKGGGGFCGCHTQDSNQNNNTTISLPFGAVMRPAAAEGDCCAHCRSLGPHQKALRLSAAAFHNVITYKSKGPGQMEQ